MRYTGTTQWRFSDYDQPNSALVGPEEETILRSPTVSAPVNAAAHQQGGEIAFARRLQEQVQSRAKVLAR